MKWISVKERLPGVEESQNILFRRNSIMLLSPVAHKPTDWGVPFEGYFVPQSKFAEREVKKYLTMMYEDYPPKDGRGVFECQVSGGLYTIDDISAWCVIERYRGE